MTISDPLRLRLSVDEVVDTLRRAEDMAQRHPHLVTQDAFIAYLEDAYLSNERGGLLSRFVAKIVGTK